MESIDSSCNNLSLNEILLYEIGLIASEFIKFKAQFVFRQCNKVVDALIDIAKSLGGVWFDHFLFSFSLKTENTTENMFGWMLLKIF